MFSAYLFHFVNLAVAFAMVPLLLYFLDSAEYVVWLIFSAFGGFTIHMQNAIQNTSVKEIARGVHLDEDLAASLQRMRSAYAGLALFVAIPYWTIGLVYLNFNDQQQFFIEWSLFVASFAVVYTIAPKHCLLLGTDRVALSNRINTVTRLLYIFVAFALLNFGLSVMAVCISFICSTALSGILSYYVTSTDRDPPWKWSLSQNIPAYAIFAVTAYALYNGAFLITAILFDKNIIASYGLGLQIALYLMILSLAPLQVWLARLVRAIASKDVKRELLKSMAFVNFIFLSGAILLFFFGDDLLKIVRSQVSLPPQLPYIFVAFWIELNIAVIVNYLMVRGNYRFVKFYVPAALCALMMGVFGIYVTRNLYVFIIVPLIIQALVCLPLIARIAVVDIRAATAGRKLNVEAGAFLKSKVY